MPRRSQSSPIEEPPIEASTPSPHAISRRVLIVEDEPRLREMLCRAVSQMEFQPTAVSSAEEAVREMSHAPAGILIVDINLPGMNGLELCEIVRQRWPESHAIILTGHGTLGAAQSAIRLEVADFLTKPCTLAEIEAALGRALRRRMEPSAGVERSDADTMVEGGWADEEDGKPTTLDEVERRHILAALERHGGNRAAAAQELGISVRTIYYRLRQYGVQDGLPVDADEPRGQGD